MTEPSAIPPEGVQLRARRSPRLIALGVLLIVLGALGAAALYTTATRHRQAVAMANDVVRGQEIRLTDLTIREVPGDYEAGMDELESLVGQRVLTDLPAGSFPARRHLGDRQFPAGNVVVGLKLGPGRMPSTTLVPGQRIQLINLAESAAVAEAQVATLPTKLDDGVTWLLDVSVSGERAAQVAALIAADQLALIALQEP